MPMSWNSDDGEVYAAEMRLTPICVVQAAVESLGETGWDWHVWDAAGRLQPHYGLADTLDDAKSKAERALELMEGQLA